MNSNKSKKPLKKSKMKFFGIINIAAVFADEMGSLLSGTELQDCGGQQCVNDSRAHGTLVCMQINDDVKSVWRSLANVENGSFKCMCVHAYNWVVANRDVDLPIAAAGTHECAWKHIKGDINPVEAGTMASSDSTDGC